MALLQSLGKLLGGVVNDAGKGFTMLNNLGAPRQAPMGGVIPNGQVPQNIPVSINPTAGEIPIGAMTHGIQPTINPAILNSSVPPAHLGLAALATLLAHHAALNSPNPALQRLSALGHTFNPGATNPATYSVGTYQQPNAPILYGHSGGNVLGPPVTSPLRGF